MSLANFISFFRIAVLPLIIFLLQRKATLTAIFVLFLAFLSDILDGYFARRRKEITRIGSFLDPFADKVLLYGLLLFFFLLGDVPLFVPALFFLRDVLLAIIRWAASNEEIHLRQEKKYTKLGSYAQYALLLSLLLQSIFPLFNVPLIVLVILALVFSYLSLLFYFSLYVHYLRKNLQRGKQIAPEPFIILANKRSRGYGDLYRRRLLHLFAKRRKAEILFLPETEDMFTGVEKKISHFKHFIIAGGDGSFESALNYSLFKKKSLGFFPLGAGNFYYSYFYRGKRFEYLRSRFHFREELLDILELTWESGKRETTLLSIGLDAEIMHLAKRKQAGAGDYVIAGIRGAFGSSAAHYFSVLVDGKKHELQNTVALTLAKVPYFGLGLRALLGETHPTDGRVYGVAVVNTHPKVSNKLVRLWALLFANFNMLKAPFVAFRGKKIEVQSDEAFPLQAGGEFLGYTKWVKVRVVRKQKVLVV